MWQREGLAAPAEVVNATGEYLAAEDAMSLWLDECCDKAPGSWTSGAELYASWKAWADRSGELAGSRRRFSERISRPWITEGRKPGDGSRGFVGVMLKPTSEMFSSVTGGQHVDDVFA